MAINVDAGKVVTVGEDIRDANVKAMNIEKLFINNSRRFLRQGFFKGDSKMGEIARIIVKGDVQGVGYRASVKYIARKMGIKGFVRNLDDGTVEIYCSSSRDNIERFIKAIDRKTEEPDEFSLNVEGIDGWYGGEEEFIKPEKELGVFEIDYREEAKTSFEKANLERLEIGTLVISRLREDTNLNFRTMDGKYLKISSNMEQLTREIRDTNQNIRTLAETFVKLVDALEKRS